MPKMVAGEGEISLGLDLEECLLVLECVRHPVPHVVEMGWDSEGAYLLRMIDEKKLTLTICEKYLISKI